MYLLDFSGKIKWLHMACVFEEKIPDELMNGKLHKLQILQ